MSEANNAVAPSKGGAMIPADLEATLDKDRGVGYEKVEAKDLRIPTIGILQALSPQVNTAHAKYIPGAQAGMILVSSTKEVFPGAQGIEFIPLFWEEKYSEWVPQKKGGGFVANHGPEILAQAKYVEEEGLLLPNGNELLISSTFYVMLKRGTFFTPAVLRMAKSMRGTGKDLLTRLKSKVYTGSDGKGRDNMPMHSMLVKLDVVVKHGEQNRSWYVWRDGDIKFLWEEGTGIAPEGINELYARCKEFGDQFRSGALDNKIDADETDSQQAGPAAQTPVDDQDEIPF